MTRGGGIRLLILLCAVACSATRPAPPPKPPEDSVLTNLTEWLKLDATQQDKTRQLLKELNDRYTRIREKWDAQGRIHPEELLESRALFSRDFVAILTEDQKRIYAEMNQKLHSRGSRVVGPGL